MEEYQVSVAQLAEAVGLSQSAIRQTLSGKTRLSVDLSLRLAKFFGNEKTYWINIQTEADIKLTEEAIKGALKDIKKVKLPKAGKVGKTAPVAKKSREKKDSAKAAPKPRGRKPAAKTATKAVKEAPKARGRKKAVVSADSETPSSPATQKSRGRPKGARNVKKVTPPVAEAPKREPRHILIKKNKKAVAAEENHDIVISDDVNANVQETPEVNTNDTQGNLDI
jgi:addiction module HigA family antidote